MRVKITPNTTYHPGHIGGLISLVAPGPMVVDKDGSVTVKLSQAQLDEFHRRGGSAHKVEILPDAPDPAPVEAAPVQQTPLQRVARPESEVQVTAQPPKTNDLTSFLQTCRALQMDDNEIVGVLVKAGWKESQAIDAVMNDMPPAA